MSLLMAKIMRYKRLPVTFLLIVFVITGALLVSQPAHADSSNTVCSNMGGSDINSADDYRWTDVNGSHDLQACHYDTSSAYGTPNQCEELVQRYANMRWRDAAPSPYVPAAGWYGVWGYDASRVWSNHPSHLTAVRNGLGSIPSVGDILVWGPTTNGSYSGTPNPPAPPGFSNGSVQDFGDAGHIGVIASENVSAGSLTTLEQNFSWNGDRASRTMTFNSNGFISATFSVPGVGSSNANEPLYGWLHDPNNGGSPPPTLHDTPLAGKWTSTSTQTGIGLYDPSSRTFYLENSQNSGNADETLVFGNTGDLPVVGDWTGTGVDTIGVYRPSNATFYLTSQNTSGAPLSVPAFTYGNPGSNWIPLVGDWNGQGHDGIGLYDPTTRTFYLRNELSAGVADYTAFTLGNTGDIPVVGRLPGQTWDSVGVYQVPTANFAFIQSAPNPTVTLPFTYGNPNDPNKIPFTGDWLGSENDGVALYDHTTTWFYIRDSMTSGTADVTAHFGNPN